MDPISYLSYQITGWKALPATMSGFDFMSQRDQTGRFFFSTNKFQILGLIKNYVSSIGEKFRGSFLRERAVVFSRA